MKLTDLNRLPTAKAFAACAPVDGPRIAVVDIETFPMLSYHWRMWKQNISTIMNVQDVTLMSFAIKWFGRPETYYLDNRGATRRKGGMRNDMNLLRALHTVLMSCDMIIAQNGKRFDLPQIKGRMAINGMQPLPPIKVIDTLLHNKNEFAFSANSLAHLSPKFTTEAKTEHANFPGFHLWLECMEDNPEAWDECETYNITDITSLEEMYTKLRGWYQGHHNYGPYVFPNGEPGMDVHVCPNCGSEAVRKRGARKTQVGIYTRYQCGGCGAWSRSRLQSVSSKERSHILVN